MIKDFMAGTKVCQAALVRVQKIGKSSNGGVFAKGILEDNSGRVAFISFDANTVDMLRSLEGPEPFMMRGTVDINKYSEEMQLQVVVQNFHQLLPEDDISNLLPVGDFDHQAYKEKLEKLILTIKTPTLRTLLNSIFKGETLEQFLKNPAGTRMHHAYLGGLLQHSVDVAQLALAMAGEIGNVNRDLVIAGALLHDIGKLKEISSQIGFPYTDQGRLLGHIAMSAMVVQEAAANLHMSGGVIEKLLHILLSHHGENEKGSPVACATKEAFIVHYADEVNAVMNQFQVAAKGPWDYNRMLQRYLYHEG